jgi:signal transduction histidine kinase
VAGLALGVWTSRRALVPLVRVNDAAAAVARGDLTATVHTDDPDLAELAGTFNATVADLRFRIERDVRFASDVSHELRSPLTTLANAVDVLAARKHELSPTGREVLAVMQAEVERFTRIVRDLLEISLDDADARLTTEPFLVAQLVRAAVDGSVPVAVDEDAEELVVNGDRRRLERVVGNLLENAEAHAGGAVGVRVQREGPAARIVVDDAGPGVPGELRREIFERFHRGSTARSGADGAGLGLALVARHVRRHDGRVWVEDRPGGGARFVVSLPVEQGVRA